MADTVGMHFHPGQLDNKLRREKMDLPTYANSKASGEPAHPPSLASSFAICFRKQ